MTIQEDDAMDQCRKGYPHEWRFLDKQFNDSIAYGKTERLRFYCTKCLAIHVKKGDS